MSAGHWASDRRPGDGHRPSSLNGSSTNRYHRLVKTFWGWGEKRLPDGTLILTSPAGHTYVTPRAARCCSPACACPPGDPGARSRPTTRLLRRAHRDDAQTPPHPRPNRADSIATERRQNHTARTAQRTESMSYAGPADPTTTRNHHRSDPEWALFVRKADRGRVQNVQRVLLLGRRDGV